MQNSQKSQKFGLQALTPIYGQVISAAPSWSGPYVPPPIPPPIQQAKQPSETGKWLGLFGNLSGTHRVYGLLQIKNPIAKDMNPMQQIQLHMRYLTSAL